MSRLAKLTIEQFADTAHASRAADFIMDTWHLDTGDFLAIAEDGVAVEDYGGNQGLLYVTLVGEISREQMDRLRAILQGQP